MKRILAFLIIPLLTLQGWAQTAEYLQQKDFQAEKKKIYESIGSAKRQLNEIKKEEAKLVQQLDSLGKALAVTGGKLTEAADSLSRTATKLNALQEKVDSEKQLSQGVVIAVMVILFALVIILFVLLLRFRKVAGQNRQSIEEFEKKLADFVEPELRNLQGDVQTNRENIRSSATDLGHKITTGLGSLESREERLELQEKEDVSGIGARLDGFSKEFARVKEELDRASKNLDDKLVALRKETESGVHELAARAGRLEEDLRAFKKK